jgi:hypothetical protein
MKTASTSFESFQETLKSINQDAHCNLKSEARIKEKAELPVDEDGYGGDYSRVLDYLRGTIYIDVDLGLDSKSLQSKVSKVLTTLQQRIGAIRRTKVFMATDEVPLPRILLNLDCHHAQGFICEVQIRFRLWGMDKVYHDFVHELYELTRKPAQDVNQKAHLLSLIRDMLAKLGIEVTEKMMLWIVRCEKVVFSQLEDQSSEDEEKVRVVTFLANKGRKKFTIQVKTAIWTRMDFGFVVRQWS